MSGFLISVLIALAIGFIGNFFVRGDMPGGPWVAFLVSLLGSWIGGYMDIFKGLGPRYNGMNLIPAIIGSVLFVAAYGIFRKAFRSTIV